MPKPIKTFRQIQSLVRQNPGAAAKRIVSINNAEKIRQSALNGLRQSNLNLRNIDKDIANTYIAYGPEPPFNPSTAFQRNQALFLRNANFENWKDRFAPMPQQTVYIPKTVNSDTFFGRPFMRVGTPVYQSYMDRMGYYSSPQPLAKQIKAPDPKAKSWSLPLSEIEFLDLPRTSYTPIPEEPLLFKKGGKIHIKKENRGKFTDYCGGKVTSECIARGKASSNPAIRKRATFAANARKWKHENGGTIEKYQLGKVFKPIVKNIGNIKGAGDIDLVKKSLNIQKQAWGLPWKKELNFWYGKVPEVGRDITHAVYFKDAMSNGTNGIMQKLALDSQKLHSGNIAALVKSGDLSIDSYPLYLKSLQRGALNGDGVFEPIIDKGVYRMIGLNPYGEGGEKSLQRIDRILKDLQTQYPNLPSRVTLSEPIDPNFDYDYFVPAFKFTHFNNGGKL